MPASYQSCKLSDDPNDTSRCDNLLPAGFEGLKPKDGPLLQSLLAQVQAIKLQSPPYGEVIEERQGNSTCAGIGGANNPVVRYSAPEALLALPWSEGSGTRQIVTAVFEVRTDKGCMEGKYGLRKAASGWTRLVQFVSTTVKANAKHDPTRNVPLGLWTSWAIASKTNGNGDTTYRLENLSHGEYLLCGTMHDSTDKQTAAFLGCEAQSGLYSAAKSGVFGQRVSLDSAIALFKAGDSTARRIVLQRLNKNQRDVGQFKPYAKTVKRADFYSLTLAAWGRCGNLGCCALE